MVAINIISCILLIAILWKISRIRKAQNRLVSILNSIHVTLEYLLEFGKHGEEKEQNIIKALQEICVVLNQSFSISGDFMNSTTFALQNLAVCMIPFIDNIKHDAIESDDYERAQECIEIIKNLQEIINPQQS